MYIPNEKIKSKMNAEKACIWYVPTNHDKDCALLIKAPTAALKAIILGCPIQLFFGLKDNFLCVGTKITDIPDNPLLLFKVQCCGVEHNALVQLCKQKSFQSFYSMKWTCA